PAPTRRGTVLRGIGIVTTGLVAGAIGVTAISSSSSAASTGSAGSAPRFGGAPGQGPQGGPPGGVDGGRGGVAGETRLRGTITAVGSASLTVKGLDGTTTTVPVNGATEIVRDGSSASLSALRAGDQVLVHVVPSGTSTVAERVFAGTSATAGPGFGGPPPGGQPPAGTTSGTGPGSRT
ncbi:MAG: DUF5666 domain-containing protein, partial [Mycobacteriales bacterium]